MNNRLRPAEVRRLLKEAITQCSRVRMRLAWGDGPLPPRAFNRIRRVDAICVEDLLANDDLMRDVRAFALYLQLFVETAINRGVRREDDLRMAKKLLLRLDMLV